MKYLSIIFLLAIMSSCSISRLQPQSSAAAKNYQQEHSVAIQTIADYDAEDGYYIFYANKEAPHQKIVFFIHGYGAINPAIYGKWIKHLVGLDCVVIYPRYQKSSYRPGPRKFAENMSKGLLGGLNQLRSSKDLIADDPEVYYFGHSYGGAASLFFGLAYQEHGLPKPAAIFACQPGTGIYKAMRKKDYAALEKDIDLVVLSSEKDKVVGDKMAERAYRTAPAQDKIWIKQRAYSADTTDLKADHSSPCSVDLELDNQVYNLVYRLILKKGKFDQEDIAGYFKISEAILEGEIGENGALDALLFSFQSGGKD